MNACVYARYVRGTLRAVLSRWGVSCTKCSAMALVFVLAVVVVVCSSCSERPLFLSSYLAAAVLSPTTLCFAVCGLCVCVFTVSRFLSKYPSTSGRPSGAAVNLEYHY